MTQKLARFIVRRRIPIFLFFLVVVGVCAFLIPQVKVNYSFQEYLPEGMPSKNGVEVQEEEFGTQESTKVMAVDVSIPQAREIKAGLEAVEYVDFVVWADSAVNLYQPEEFVDQDELQKYYKDNKALFTVYFDKQADTEQLDAAINTIEETYGEQIYMSGGAKDSKTVRETTEAETTRISIVVVPIVLIILFLATTSWLEPLLFLVIIGASIVINMGSNVLFPHISFVTNSMLFVLQLAISMDYSIFLLHRFAEERARGLEVEPAMVNAIQNSISSIVSSSLTTVAGFLSLVLMRFTIGADIGLVFSKGILITLICVIFLFPAIIIFFAKPIEKLQHRSFIPPLGWLGRFAYKFRVVLFVVVILLAVPSYIAQTKNEFIYGQSSLTADEGTASYDAYLKITETFGRDNPVVLLVPRGDLEKEMKLCDDLQALDAVSTVQARVTLAAVTIPDDMLPDGVVNQFMSENYSRIIVSLATLEESPTAYEATAEVSAVAEKYYPGAFHTVGSTAVSADVRDVTHSDSIIVNLLSILSVWVILLLTFRSFSLPFILVASIEVAIFINMAIPYFTDLSMVYIGYLIISSIQLGATIDYAILMASRYLEARQQMGKKEAAIHALNTAGGSVVTSAFILFVAGMVLGAISTVSTISQMGTLVGRGAVLSGIMVLLVLPQLLVLFDRVIEKTTRKTNFYKEGAEQ